MGLMGLVMSVMGAYMGYELDLLSHLSFQVEPQNVGNMTALVC